MLFLGLGTGLGIAMIVDGVVEPMELGHLPYKKKTYEDYVGNRGLEKLGKKEWRECVNDVVQRLTAALEPDDVVLGGGNIHKLKELPAGCRVGDNENAFTGGFRLWETDHRSRTRQSSDSCSRSLTCQRSDVPAWQALQSHVATFENLDLRELFADDPGRGERMAIEAVGVYFDYSKNRITDETLKLLIQLAEKSGLRSRIIPELDTEDATKLKHDSSTNTLIERYRRSKI